MKKKGAFQSNADVNALFFPRITFSFVGLTILFFVLQIISQAVLGWDVLVEWGAKDNGLIRAGQMWRLVTPLFLHGSVLHLGFNLLVVFIMGGYLERIFGNRRFFLLYFLSGFAGYAFSFLLSGGATIGSSTVVYGLAGAAVLTWYRNRRTSFLFPKWLTGLLVFIVITSFLSESVSHVDDFAHAGGLLGGSMFTWFAGPLWKDDGIQLTDKHLPRDVVIGAAMVLLIFGLLAMWGMVGWMGDK